jgi:hypothetical protein
MAVLELCDEQANNLFKKVKKEGKFVCIEYKEGIICGGCFVISDMPPF